MPRVSVIVPTYNRGEVIPRAVDSVLEQSFNDFELIIVDDGSDDGTRRIIQEYNDSRINYIQHNENRGACAARNTGIDASSGELIAFLDSDDKWHPKKIERQIGKFQSSADDVGVVYTGYEVERDGVTELGQIPKKSGDIFEDQLMTDWVTGTPTLMVKREALDCVGGFNTDLPARQDYEFCLRLAKEYKFEYIRAPLVTVYVDSDNRLTDNITNRIYAHEFILKEYGDYIGDLPRRKQQRAYSRQYYDIGRLYQRNSDFLKSIRYMCKSIRFFPLNPKSYISLILSFFRVSTTEQWAIKLKNTIKKVYR